MRLVSRGFAQESRLRCLGAASHRSSMALSVGELCGIGIVLVRAVVRDRRAVRLGRRRRRGRRRHRLGCVRLLLAPSAVLVEVVRVRLTMRRIELRLRQL